MVWLLDTNILSELRRSKLQRRVVEFVGNIAARQAMTPIYRAQATGPFEQESRIRDLLARQAQLNAVLDF